MTNYRWGPRQEGGYTNFRLWAPSAERVVLDRAGAEPVSMTQAGDGWWEARCAARKGARYRFRIGDMTVPDPASRRQDGDVHGWSVVEENDYAWQVHSWRPRAWHETVLYELHPGVFGGFRGIIDHLDRLAKLGITAIELMPIGDFPGGRNWGYDGVLPYAPDESYGTPDDLKALVDAAHQRGLMIFLDVVYNHFGPDGNYLPAYAKDFFRSDRKTPWGDAIDFRKAPVRRFFIENALYWLSEFRIDGLRFDAVHAIEDDAFLADMAKEIKTAFPDRHLVLENEDNNAPLLSQYDAQWNDDFHNTLHAILTEESAGYYADFAKDSMTKLARLLRDGFAFQGEHMEHLERGRGAPSSHLPPTAFVSFLQNHDQVGNRALGERLIELIDVKVLRAAVALQLLCPQIPMLFMGEEIGAREPFLYFTDHQDLTLAKAVSEGRAAEFSKFPEFSSGKLKVPDPNAEETFQKSHLGEADHSWVDFYQALLALRHHLIIPHLKACKAIGSSILGEKAVMASWRLGDGSTLTIASNFSDAAVKASLPRLAPFFGENEGDNLPSATTLAWIEEA